MIATLLTGTGGIDKLVFSNIDKPVISPQQALVKVKYCGVNHLDTLIRQGKRLGPEKFPHILGSEIVGEIVELGSEQKHFKISDNVAVYPWTFDGTCSYCKAGSQNICDSMGTIGRTQWGGYAEYVEVPIQNLIKLPKNILFDEACAITLAGATAVHLIERANVKNNSTVLVTGATGGVGTIVVQILKNKNCKIICATSHNEKKSVLEQLGALHVVSTQKMIEDIRKLFPQGVEYVIDIVGGDVWSKGVEVLGKNGTIVFCATSSGELGNVNIGSVFSRQLTILGSYGGTIKNLKTAITLLQKKAIKPIIDSVYQLQDAQVAHEKIDSQKAIGKILLYP